MVARQDERADSVFTQEQILDMTLKTTEVPARLDDEDEDKTKTPSSIQV